MTNLKLLSVDATFAFCDPNVISQELIDAYQYTTTFSQAVARKVNPDPSTSAYFYAMRDEYSRIGWNILEADQITYNQQGRKISPGDIVKQIIHPYLESNQAAQLDGILNAIQQPDAGIHDFMSFFWNKSHVGSSKTAMAFGPFISYLGMPSVTILYYSFNYNADSWRSMFIEQDEASLDTQVYHLKMDLNMSLYNSVKDAIISKIKGHEEDHIRNADIDI
jgi:hypothetical protein